MICVIKDCGNQAKTRGLCEKCYGNAANAVHFKITTWKELEKLGMSLPTNRKLSRFRKLLVEKKK